MRSLTSVLVLAIAAALPAGPFALPAHAQPRYTFTDLGTLPGGTDTEARGINGHGVVVGHSRVGGRPHAFVYERGVMYDLGVFGQREAMAGRINDAGQVTISTIVQQGDIGVSGPGFLYDRRDGSARQLPTLGGSLGEGTDINRSGQMAGISRLAGSARLRAVRYDDSGRTITDLGVLGGDRSIANGINDAGDVVGESTNGELDGNTQIYRAFLHRNGAMIDLGALGGDNSVAYDINNRGQVVGMAEFDPDRSSRWHAFLYEDGVMRDLGSLMVNSYARSINEHGVVVGEMTDASQLNDRAFVYTAGQLHDLNDLAALPAGWTLREAEEVNDLGQIVGWGTNAQGRQAAFLLTPVPEPSAMAVVACAIALLARRRRQRTQ